MRYISKNFAPTEVACRCGVCNKFTADVELVRVMQDLRDHFGVPVFVHSWFRCMEHNNRPTDQYSAYGVAGAGSNSNSWHPLGGAIDFHVLGVKHEDVAKFLRNKYPDKYGIGVYPWGVHLDIRPDRADW